MLEFPEAVVLAEDLNKTIKGKEIVDVIPGDIEHKFAFFSGDPNDYKGKMIHKKVGESRAYGPLVEVDLEDYFMIFGDGANVRYLEKDAKLPQKYQLAVQFEDGTHLVCSIAMYGRIGLEQRGNYDSFYYQVAVEKPTMISDDFNLNYFNLIVKEAKDSLSVKALLATEQRIPGLGNGVLQDILFEAKVNPRTKIKDLSSKQLEDIYHAIKKVIPKIIAEGGRDVDKNLFGKPGGYQTVLSSKTVKKPCPVCGNTISKEAFLGGSVYYCPKCQPK